MSPVQITADRESNSASDVTALRDEMPERCECRFRREAEREIARDRDRDPEVNP